MMNQYAYIRISTLQQNTDRQTLALSDFQIPEDHIFTDKQSGKDFDRPQYKKLISRLAPGGPDVNTANTQTFQALLRGRLFLRFGDWNFQKTGVIII